VIISPSSSQSITYFTKDSAVSITSLEFTENLGTCGVFTYSITNSDLTAVDTTVFSLNTSTADIVLSTIDPTKVGSYLLILTGTLGSWGSATTTISVTINLCCYDNTITPDAIGHQIFSLYGSATVFSFNEWTSSSSVCGTFTYTVT
jgi:hypothetical protein